MARQPQEHTARKARGATGARFTLRQQLVGYLLHHRQTFQASFDRMKASPVQTSLTIFVIAIALSLPAALFTAVDNLRGLVGEIEVSARMTVFLKKELDEAAIQQVIRRFKAREDMASVEYISREQALAEFRTTSGFGDVLGMLDENPLPAVIVLQPKESLASNTQIVEAIAHELEKETTVDDVIVDLAWLQRLQILIEAGRKLTFALGALLGIGVILIMGNTIRLAIENRREEIVVVKLIGGTDSYVRRPFLYTGLWYGVGGGILAWILVWFAVIWLSSTIERLAVAYQAELDLAGPGFMSFLVLLIGGGLLGLFGAYVAVTQHAKAIEPE